MRRNPKSLQMNYTMGKINNDRATKIVGTDMLLKAINKLPKQQKLSMLYQIKALTGYTDPAQAQFALNRIVDNLKAYQVTQGLGSMIPAVANVREVIPTMMTTIDTNKVNKEIEKVKASLVEVSLVEKLKNNFGVKKALPVQASSTAVINRLKNAVNQVDQMVMEYAKEGEGHYATPNFPTPYCDDGLNYCADFNFESSDYGDFSIIGSDEFHSANFDDVMDEIKKRRDNIKAIIENQPIGNIQKGKLFSLFAKLGEMIKIGKEGKEDEVRDYMTYKFAQDSDETDFIPKDFETVDDFNDTEEIVFKEYEEEVEIIAHNNKPVTAEELESPMKIGNIEVKTIKAGALKNWFKEILKRN